MDTPISTPPTKYSSIAISGPPGAGRSTLLRNLRPIVTAWGWNTFSGGEWARTFAILSGKHNEKDVTHHMATDYSDEIDHEIDAKMREKLSDPTAHYAIESWIAGWNMRGLSHVLKVLLQCDDSLRIDRLVNRDNLSVDEAKAHIHARQNANFTKWERMYNVTDYWDPKYYDLIINTYSTGPKETCDLVINALYGR